MQPWRIPTLDIKNILITDSGMLAFYKNDILFNIYYESVWYSGMCINCENRYIRVRINAIWK